MSEKQRSRREFLTAGVAFSVLLAGCSGEESAGTTTKGEKKTTTESTQSGSDSSSSSTSATDTEEESEGENTTTQQTDTETDSSATFAVKVKYDGGWQGSIATGGSSQSIEGEGTETIEISGNPDMVSTNAQKGGKGSGKKLTIQILKEGKVVKESSTSAEYGMAQTTWSSLDPGSGNKSDSKSPYSIRVKYDGDWQGSVATGGNSRSVEGSGTKKIDIKGNPDMISANAQKKDGGGGKLTIQILKNGDVVKEATTSAEYGMAQVSVTNF